MKPLAWVLAGLLSCQLCLTVRAAQSGEPALVLDEAIVRVERALQTTGDQQAAEASAALSLLDGDPMLSNNAWLREPLAASPADLETAHARLRAAQSLARAARLPREPTADRSALDYVLAGPPFASTWSRNLPGWLVRALIVGGALLGMLGSLVRWPFDRLGEGLARLFDVLFDSPLVLPLMVLTLVALLLLYRRALQAAIVSQAEVAPPSAGLPPTSAEALVEARRLAAVGSYRDACHFVLLSTLLGMQETGAARFDPAATNREHLERVAELPTVAAALQQVVSRFDRLWYGQAAVSDADYQDLLRAAGLARSHA